MTPDLPDFLKSGERARLIPAVSASQREQQAASVLLAALTVIQPFAKDVFATLGRSIGTRTQIDAFTEIVFRKQLPALSTRPDGLIIINTGRTVWSALIEAKIGSAQIDGAQIQNYARLARDNGIDAVITISNQLCTLPEHPPYELPKSTGKKVDIFHWSWLKLITLGALLSGGNEELDVEQSFMLREVLRFFAHKNIDVRGYSSMNREWPALVGKVQAGAKLNKHDIDVVSTVRGWHEEQQELCLILSRNLNVPVTLKLTKQQRESQATRIDEDAARLADTNCLLAEVKLPEFDKPLRVVADLLRRNIKTSVEIDAPADQKKAQTRIRWLVNQFPEDSPKDIYIYIRWNGGVLTHARLKELRENIEAASRGAENLIPQKFEIALVADLESRFGGPKTFIEGIETVVPQFYDRVARHIKGWRPKPPVGPADRGERTLEQEIEELPVVPPHPRRVKRRGRIMDVAFTLYENGEIELETRDGTKWFKDLEAFQVHVEETHAPQQERA